MKIFFVYLNLVTALRTKQQRGFLLLFRSLRIFVSESRPVTERRHKIKLNTIRHYETIFPVLHYCGDDARNRLRQRVRRARAPTPPEPEDKSHTLIIYMMGDNGLEKFMDNNIGKIMTVVDKIPQTGRIALFYDRGNYTRLSELVVEQGRAKQRVIEEYATSQSSVDPEFMKSVIERVRKEMPADTYGLVLSSHGGGWVPSDIFDIYMLGRPETSGIAPRFFGQDGNDCMEVEQLAGVLGDKQFDYILFDACFMSSVEALYELRNAADYIIASPAEVLGDGFPYKEIIPMLFNRGHDLENVCRSFMNFYRNSSGTIALIDCKELQPLADNVAAILAKAPAAPDTSNVQAYEGFPSHLYFDLEQYVETLTTDQTALDGFRKALGKAVVYTNHTETFYTDYGQRGEVALPPRSCGVTCHIERSDFSRDARRFPRKHHGPRR